MNVLRNITSDSNAVALNPRQIVFISPRSAQPGTLPRGGISQTAGTAGQYMDPWGSQYNVAIDTTFTITRSERLIPTPTPMEVQEKTPYGKG